MRQSFWDTLLHPSVHGDPYALVLTIAVQTAFCVWNYRKQQHGLALFMGIVASANLTRLLEGTKL